MNFVALCLLTLAPVANVLATEDVIRDVRVEGLLRVETEAALAGTKSKAGAPLDANLVAEDLRTVWKTGLFRDVRVEKEKTADGWVLVFIVDEKPSVKEIRFSGRDAVSEDDVKGVVDVKPYTILNTEQLKKNAAKIRDLYVEKGYYLADVSHHVETVPKDPHQVIVIFDIVENAKVVVKQVSFVGNKELSVDTIKGAMQTREGHEFSWLTQAGTYKEDFLQADLLRIQALYLDYGYVTVKVGQPSVTISKDKKFIFVSIPIEEGLKYDIGEVTFAGEVRLEEKDAATGKPKVLVDENKLRDLLTIHSGEAFNRSKLATDLENLTNAYRDVGYAYANITPNTQVHADTRRVDLNLEVERGELVFFERIEIVGNTRTRDKVIRRRMRIFEGERYSATDMERSKERITQLGFFETVNVTTSRGGKSNTMNATVEVKERSTGTFQVGAGFSSAESFIATAQVSQNNFLGNGQLMALQIQASFGGQFGRQFASFEFYEPNLFDTDWSGSFEAYVRQSFRRDFQRNSQGFTPHVGYLLTPQLRLSAGYRLEHVEISLQDSIGARLANLNVDGFNSSVETILAFDTRNNQLFPTSGQYHSFNFAFSDRSLGSSERLEFRRFDLNLRFYRQLPLSLVLKFNADFGLVMGRGDQPVPISERYFPGGIYSVRGFELAGLGPTIAVPRSDDPSASSGSFTIGGNKQSVFNLELEFPLIEQAQIRGVVFGDAGNAYSDDQGFFYLGTPKTERPSAYLMRSGRRIDPPLGLFYSFGFGFRWFSPIGKLRFEWGIPITKRQPGDRGLIFEFTIGDIF